MFFKNVEVHNNCELDKVIFFLERYKRDSNCTEGDIK